MGTAAMRGRRPALSTAARVRGRPAPVRYDPWSDLHRNWPSIRLVVEAMEDDLLGELRLDDGVIALRAGTTAAQSRCTLAHEIVHLERGVRDCGPWLQREEQAVHRAAARRLIWIEDLIDAMRHLGGSADRAALAHLLEVDSETLAVRLAGLEPFEVRTIQKALARSTTLWSVA